MRALPAAGPLLAQTIIELYRDYLVARAVALPIHPYACPPLPPHHHADTLLTRTHYLTLTLYPTPRKGGA